MQKLVSAIVTTYMRDPDMVVRAVRSILTQSYPNIEIIVVDDSPEAFPMRSQVREAVCDLDHRIRYICHEQNLGACAARNTGLQAAKGDFVAYLDDDDEWLPEKICKQLQKFDSDQISLVYCGSITCDDLKENESIVPKQYISGFVYEKLLWENFIGSTSFPLIRRCCLEEIGGFDPQMQSAQDYDVWTRLAQKYEVSYVDEPLVRYHYHGNEQITGNPKKRIAGQERYIEKNLLALKQHNVLWWRRHIRLSTEYGKDRQLGKALKIWLCTAIRCPLKLYDNVYYFLKIFKYFGDSFR